HAGEWLVRAVVVHPRFAPVRRWKTRRRPPQGAFAPEKPCGSRQYKARPTPPRRLARVPGCPPADLTLRPTHPFDRVSGCAAGEFIAQLSDVGYLCVQAADRVVEHREGEALVGILGDAEFLGPLPRPE